MTDLNAEQKQSNEDSELRLALLQSFSQFYGNLVGFLNKLNLNPTLKSHCYQNFDQGAMWAREAISTLQFTQKIAPSTEQAKSETNPSVSEPEATAEL